MARTAGVSLVLALVIAFTLPKQYESGARIMPPSNSMGGAAVLAALAGRAGGSLGSLGALASGFLGGGGNTALFIDLLRSGTVSGHLIDRFDLQRIYHKRYRIDTAKYLAHHTKIVDDKKSGVITLTVTDTDPARARDIAQGYLDELNRLVNSTNTSSAHQERLFIEKRLHGVQEDLQKAQQQLSQFSSTHATIDIKEQGRAMVDAAARLQAQLIVEQSGLDSLRQTYGDGNVRIRSAQARISELQAQIAKMGGSSKAIPADDSATVDDTATASRSEDLYPPLRQLPRLAVPYANLYRGVQVQEAVYELLTQQYELARIQEAKDVPVVSVIDAPGIPEKKSFPPRLLLALLITAISVVIASAFILFRDQWMHVPADDPRKALALEICDSIHRRLAASMQWRKATP
ncbi:GumC family protein [Acidicapsa acidisoli]|uniref:GumC family protein n=1 Tax=Acidicapsa acidisoli TaxID=1615681 RepID=UPI0021E0D15E|nr:GNVR domain-containing protein [Acidicapsa acidisoli]